MEPNPLITRRQMLWRSTCTIGSLSLVGYFASEASPPAPAPAQAGGGISQSNAKARSVIRFFVEGGPSQMDTFDYKPRLAREDGKPLPFALPPVSNGIANRIFRSPYRFAQHGQTGLWVSEVFPQVATCADDLTVIHSMFHTQNDHQIARCFTSTGHERSGRPSLGAWVLYGLGSGNQNLPGFVALVAGEPQDDRLSCGFLPPVYLATRFHDRDCPIPDLLRRESSQGLQQSKLAFVQRLNRWEAERVGRHTLTDAADASRERAISMQRSVPELYNFHDETEETQALYGIPDAVTRNIGTQCLIARRLIERGVRFVEVNLGGWDHHDKLRQNLPQRALETDRPIAGLLKDLKRRGLLDSTLVMWGGEFGRTPHGDDGREHNPFGYTIWLAGGGVKAGYVHGATDDYGYFAVADRVGVHDLHATILHLLGLDHTRLVYWFGGRDYRLTDVEGEIVHDIIA